MTDETIRRLTRGFFSKKELECRCGLCESDCRLNSDFLDKLLKFRVLLGIPFTPTSCYRCRKHFKYSRNHAGYAFDIPCDHSVPRFKIIEAGLKAGFTRIGIAKDFVHLDCNPEHNNFVLEKAVWMYEE